MRPLGGSEIVYNNILKYVSNINKINLIVSVCSPDLLQKDKPNVILQGLSYNQQNVAAMQNAQFKDNVDYFVFVSHWQYEKFREIYKVPENKSIILKNAIDSIDYTPRKKEDKLKLIYTSTPWRGLNVLLKSFELLNRDDVELHIYSSVIIYGGQFAKQTEKEYQPLFDKAKAMKNVIYHGYGTNEEVRRAVTEAHIFAYPSIFEETSCISAIEAGMAGCKMVVTNYGALFETCSEFAEYVSYNSNLQELAKEYATKLNDTIDSYWDADNQIKLENQAKYFKSFYSWDARAKEWENFINKNFKKIDVNSVEYWDGVYTKEKENNSILRVDPIGWRERIKVLKPSYKVLDFGCGNGDFLVEIKKYIDGVDLTGVDHSQVGLNILKEKDACVQSYLSLNDIPDGVKFDVIYASHVIEHFENPAEVIDNLKEKLLVDGLLVVTIPIEDKKWGEHHKVWELPDFLNFLNKFDCTYIIEYRDAIIKPKEVTGLATDVAITHADGTNWKEATAYIWFNS